MKCRIIVILLFFISKINFAQEKINYRYFSIDSIEVAKEKFDADFDRNRSKNVPAYFMNINDTLFVRLVKREVFGKIPETQVNQIKQYFLSMDKTLDITKSILIKYFQGDDPCTGFGVDRSIILDEYEIKLKNLLNRKSAIDYIKIKSGEFSVNNRTSKPNEWYFDKYSILRKFFPLHYPCGSFMILKPNGEYLIHYGEYGNQNITNSLSSMKIK